MGEAVIFAGPSFGRCPVATSEADELDVLIESLIDRLQGHSSRPAASAVADATLIARLRSTVTATSRTVNELRTRVSALEQLALTDELTGLLNRRGFTLELERALARSRRYGDEGALIYIDIDAFKRINDAHGHAAGDAVLRHIARLLRAGVRCTDHVGRLGGDEFAVLFSRASARGSRKRAAQLAAWLQGIEVSFGALTIPVSASLGMQTYGSDHGLDADVLIAGADRAMYAEKANRRAGAARCKRAAAG